MPHPLLDVDHLTDEVEPYLRSVGDVFSVFGRQDSGCHSIGLALGNERWFVKFSVAEWAIRSLKRAISLHREVTHPVVIPLRHVLRVPSGLALVYSWVDGEVLYGAPVAGRAQRLNPEGAHARFRSLDTDEILSALDAIFDAHLTIATCGFVAVDLYDGCFIYDFRAERVWLCDLDEYRRGPFVLEQDRLPGSLRFMAPEEFRRGATIGQRTTVFNLGRSAQVLLDEGDLQDRFRGTSLQAAVADRATRSDPVGRYGSVPDFVAAWRAASGHRW